MDKEPEISIVVPIYNCDKFLRGCLQSVLDQTFDSYEVLMVNNRSTDSSEQIAREFDKKDSRFRLIQCKSGLAGSTRNIGIHAARGKYLAFLDGDDKLLPDYMKKLHSAAEKYHADIVVCGFYIYYLNKEKRRKSGRIPHVAVYDNIEAMKELLRDRYMRFYLWNKLWKRTLFSETGIEIPDMYYEDAAVCPQLFSHAEKVVMIDDCLYEYMRYNSAVMEINMGPQRINDYINTIPIIRLFLEDQGNYKTVERSFQKHISHVVLSLPLLCIQSKRDLNDGVLKNASRGIKKAFKCSKMPANELKHLEIRSDTVR